jgi:hypothetical protein
MSFASAVLFYGANKTTRAGRATDNRKTISVHLRAHSAYNYVYGSGLQDLQAIYCFRTSNRADINAKLLDVTKKHNYFLNS